MKRLFISTATLLIALTGVSQQLQTSSMYEMQSLLHNAATAGLFQDDLIGASYRSQWTGISGSPRTAMVFGSYNLKTSASADICSPIKPALLPEPVYPPLLRNT
jgi:hypothetical protein